MGEKATQWLMAKIEISVIDAIWLIPFSSAQMPMANIWQ